jgi:NhaP-type Na+/H+ or K+/H+ antiporter
MYRTITEFHYDEHKNLILQILAPFGQFIILFLGSFLIGAISALIIAFIMKRVKRSGTIKMNNEISMMILCPWVSYLIAEGLKFSGIVSILINGVFLAQYVLPNLSKTSKKVINAGYETLAWGAESIVFLFIGIGMFGINEPFDQIGALGIISACILLNVARALNIGIISAICNLTRKENKINYKFQFIMWVAGLRGAMAYALALESFSDYSTGKVMLVITLVYALFSVLIIGSIFNPLITYFKIEKTDEDLQTQIEIDESFYNAREFVKVANWGEKMKMKLFKFNTQYFKPIFVVNKEEAEKIADQHEDNSTVSKPQRKSESDIYELDFDNNDLRPKVMHKRLSLDSKSLNQNST